MSLSRALSALSTRQALTPALVTAARSFGTSAGVGNEVFVKDLIKARKGQVLQVHTNATCTQAAKIMNEKNVGSAIVMKGDEVFGIVTERDFLKKVVVPNVNSDKVTVGEIATTDVIAVDEAQTVGSCMSLMQQAGLRHLPVVRDGKIVDVLSIRDLVTAIHESQHTELHYLRDMVGYQGNMYSAAR
eukprot:comp21113_c0_seq1/m.28531 comp21113_c0_seq1/g.28531  ORF comp21113_c0_seq1/g.28531 comp21113_c0_seq1/m.28531 type:complete len:187 (-) comp21113_c0_seq1:359-919(-)